MLATAVGALTLAAAGAAASVTVQIRSTGFSPATITINHDDKVTWHNADKVDHQVVSDDGSFASPILHAGQSWTKTLSTAGTFRYHDALYPRRTGKITVKGPPPSVSLALSVPIVVYGTPVTLSGAISTGAANQSVELDQQPYGQASASQIVDRQDRGRRRLLLDDHAEPLHDVHRALEQRHERERRRSGRAEDAGSIPGGNGYMKAEISSPVSLWHKHVSLQRLSQFGQWVNIANLTLGQLNGRLFKPTAYLPKGVSRIRVFLSINQAGNGLLAAHSGTQTIVRRK